MSIKSISVNNLLSFDELYIENVKDINCIIGRNNVGKSNLLKLIKFFYNKLEEKRELPPTLNSNYSSYGTVTIEYDLTRISKIVSATKNRKNQFFKYIASVLFPSHWSEKFTSKKSKEYIYNLTLIIHSNDTVEWNNKNKEARKLINIIFPFFEIEARNIDLYDWDKLWYLTSRLKSFKVENIDYNEVINFFDERLAEHDKAYSDYISRISKITKTSKYTYRERVLNYIKVGLKGQTFTIDGEKLVTQSDGTNSHKYIELFLELLISLTRRNYISPIVYIDEPEIGLHPKKNEQLISKLYDIFTSFKKTRLEYELGKYQTPYPQIFMATHSPNILKMLIKLFKDNQQVLHFSKEKNTKVTKMNSIHSDLRFLNVFGDNEARLFFSEGILFVEGETELELFSNFKLLNKYSHLKNLDIYKANNLVLKYVNPAYTNTAIPFLVLYDADKLLSFDFKENKITLKTDTVNIEKFKDKYSYVNYKTPYFKQERKNTIDKLLIKLDQKVEYSSTKLNVKNESINDLIKQVNDVIINKNHWIASSTIEGMLINNKSFTLFKKWLKYEINHHLYIKQTTGDINRKITAEINEFQSNNDILKVCDALLSSELNTLNLCEPQRKFIKNIKKQLVSYLFCKLRDDFSSFKDRVTVMRLIFSGKSETLVSMANKDYENYIDSSLRKKIADLKTDMIIINHLFNKTSGWVTKFLNFAVDDIEKYKREKLFDEQFELFFPELYSIIKKLQF